MITKNDIRHAISHTTDGPVNTFVLISRSIRMAGERPNFGEYIANALYEELLDRRLLAANEHSEDSQE